MIKKIEKEDEKLVAESEKTMSIIRVKCCSPNSIVKINNKRKIPI